MAIFNEQAQRVRVSSKIPTCESLVGHIKERKVIFSLKKKCGRIERTLELNTWVHSKKSHHISMTSGIAITCGHRANLCLSADIIQTMLNACVRILKKNTQPLAL